MDIWEKHGEKVSKLSIELGKILGLKDTNLKMLYISSKYHDIGKAKINTDILNKKEKLSNYEMNIVKNHTLYGYDILQKKGFNKEILEAVLYHHEKYDGTGYLKGLKGSEIPLFSRIISVVDTYDCITSKRTYKKKLSHEYAINEIELNAGKQFDPIVVYAFKNVVK